jgi:urease accessory protein
MLRQLGHAGLPLVLAVWQQPERLPELDRLCEAFTSNHVANRASRLQGQALLASAERIFQAPALSALRESGPPPFGHLAPVFGAVAGALGIGRRPTAQLYFFQHLRGVLAAAVRLGIVGPLEAQSLQHRLASVAQQVLENCEHRSVADLTQTAPWFDLWQGGQDRLYSRLFQS